MIGVIVRPMPRPITNSAPPITQYEVSAPMNGNVSIAAKMTVMPLRTNLPGPIRSVSRPRPAS